MGEIIYPRYVYHLIKGIKMIKEVRKEVYTCYPYVPGKSMDDVMDEYHLEHVVKLGSNENPYAPFDLSSKIMRDEVSKINTYPEKNFIKLKSILADSYNLRPEFVALGHGAGGVLDTLAKTFINSGDEIITAEQTYGLYGEISKGMGGILKLVPLTSDFKFDLLNVSKSITSKTKLIWLCNPNNPTGTVFEPDEFYSFMETLPEHVWVVLDEAYIEFAAKDKRIEVTRLIQQGKKIIKVGTLSKYYGLAGARIGYCVSQPDVITAYDTISEPFNANRIGLAGAVCVLTDDKPTADKVGNKIIEDRDNLINQLNELGCQCDISHTNFVFFSTPHKANELADKLLTQGVIVRPCAGWGFTHHIRVTIGTSEQNTIFLATLKETLALMDEGK